MSRRSVAVIVFVAGFLLFKKIWEKFRGAEIISSFVEKYLCDNKAKGSLSVD